MGLIEVTKLQGITDNVLNGNPYLCEEIDNLIITDRLGGRPRCGYEIVDSSYYQLPTQSRVLAMFEHLSKRFSCTEDSIYYEDSGWQLLSGPTGNKPFNLATSSSFVAFDRWRDHILISCDSANKPIKMYRDSGGTWRLQTAGLPELGSDPTVTPDANDSKSYIYDFMYYRSYTVGTKTFEDFGPVTSVQVTSAADMSASGHYNQISSIPTLSNAAGDNYDTTNMKIKIYRTTHGGKVKRYVGQVDNGTTTFTDTVTDATLASNDRCYRSLGKPDFSAPPAASYFKVVNSMGFYGYGSTLYQSIPDDVDSVPSDYTLDMGAEIVGIGRVGIYPVVFCDDGKLYRVTNFFDAYGRGYMAKELISDTHGLAGHNSIAETSEGLYFAGKDGFCFTDGYRVLKISDLFNATYRRITNTETKRNRIYASYDRVNSRVYWACQRESGSPDNDSMFVFYERYGRKPDGVFTTMSSQEAFYPTAFYFDDSTGNLIHGDRGGILFEHDDSYYTDPDVNYFQTPDFWNTKAIIWRLKTSVLNGGSDLVRKVASELFFEFENDGNFDVQASAARDGSKEFSNLALIRNTGHLVWDDPNIAWDDSTIEWDPSGTKVFKRRQPGGSVRFTQKQVLLTNAYTVIQASDDYEAATIAVDPSDSDQKTVTLTNWEWDQYCGGLDFYEETDSYARSYKILSRTATELTIFDPDDTCATGSKKWMIKGYRKLDRPSLVAILIPFRPVSASHLPYDGETGENS